MREDKVEKNRMKGGHRRTFQKHHGVVVKRSAKRGAKTKTIREALRESEAAQLEPCPECGDMKFGECIGCPRDPGDHPCWGPCPSCSSCGRARQPARP